MPTPPSAPKQTLAMIHTVAGLIPVFNDLADRTVPGWAVFNMVDESLLRTTIHDGQVSQTTLRRLTGMIWSAVEAGADAVVVTCSSLGGAVDTARPLCPAKLFRIDEGMAIAAVGMGPRIGVLATLATTLDPTSALIARIAAQHGGPCVLTARLADGAFEKLHQGDPDGHDAMVAQSLRDMAPSVDVIVLAQASMARALAGVQGELGSLAVLTSPELGMTHIGLSLAG